MDYNITLKTPKLQNSKTPKLQNSKTPKLQNSKTPKLQNSKTPATQLSGTLQIWLRLGRFGKNLNWRKKLITMWNRYYFVLGSKIYSYNG